MKKIKNSLPAMGALFALLLLASPAAAAPITFAFEAEIDTISPGASFDSKITLAVGDVITGQFTFEPNAGNGSSSLVVEQPVNFTVNISGVELSVAAFTATSYNDAHVDVDCMSLLCPGFALSDGLAIDGSNLMEVGDNALSNLDTSSSGFQVSLEEWFGNPFWDGINVLDTAEIPTDVEAWNQFSGRPLRIWLVDDQGGTFSLNATVGKFTVIPEPSSGSLIYLGAMIIGIAARADWNAVINDFNYDDNDDLVINAADYQIWQQNFGLSLDLENVVV